MRQRGDRPPPVVHHRSFCPVRRLLHDLVRVHGCFLEGRHWDPQGAPPPPCSSITCDGRRSAGLSLSSLASFLQLVAQLAGVLSTASATNSDGEFQTQFRCRTDRSGLVGDAPWITVPYPFQWGALTFHAAECFAMMAAAFVALVERYGYEDDVLKKHHQLSPSSSACRRHSQVVSVLHPGWRG
ncbi:uncharacterized protein LOC119268449 isoform X2 [Triticum dicoccoides]|uniref:uncharacterized protein LOC119268449 isoform X2 n=1 Tax=Triticum dicoccoides TaxID=85692 RepID=UPI0018903295|nr:uncharacterized protein LOC119268449 isoform X2 [Triticum dicoccoides]